MFKILLFIASYLYSISSFAGSTAQDWAKITTPTFNSVSQSIGDYTNGCISGAVTLPA
jgi:penicillin-insensitive murein DD-endopeptidase